MLECDGEAVSFNSRELLRSMDPHEHVSEYVKSRRTEVGS